MPSWNVHCAHVEALLRDPDFLQLGIRDADEFFFGNVVPDIPLGYIVKDPELNCSYQETHWTDPAHIPLPREDLFWERYIDGTPHPADMCLGAWTHLLCDHVYNAHTRAFFEARGIEPSERARIDKQSDFAAFGRSLKLSRKLELSEKLVCAAAVFPQFSIGRGDVAKTVDVVNAIVEENELQESHALEGLVMLDEDFFVQAFAEAQTQLKDKLLKRVQHT